jgi:hypothetical protein
MHAFVRAIAKRSSEVARRHELLPAVVRLASARRAAPVGTMLANAAALTLPMIAAQPVSAQFATRAFEALRLQTAALW